MKKVSVIVPVYNSEMYLKECMDSLVNQTLEEIEIIVVNDGSTDNSLPMLERYQEQFPDKVVLHSKENGGQATARNLGISLATGEYIGFVDSDDSVDLNMFADMYASAVEEKADFVECSYAYMQVLENGEIKRLPCYGNVREYHSISEMFINPLVSPWNKLYKASVLKEHDIRFPEGVIYEDTAFHIKSIPYIGKTVYLEKEYVNHYLRTGSTMNAKRDVRVGNIFAVLEDIIRYYQENALFEKYRAELEFFCVKILLCSSLERIARVTDSKLRKEYLRKTLSVIAEHFPNYRKNKYMLTGMNGIYMKSINAVTIHLFAFVLRLKAQI